MVTDPREHVWSKLAGLCAPLHSAFEAAAERADDMTGDSLPGADYDYARTHVTRALAHRALATSVDLAGWQVTGRHRRNGELWLRHGMTRIRILHTGSQHLIPPAGPGRRRRAYYRNPPLVHLPGQIALAWAEQSQLVAAWRVTDRLSYTVGIRVVRPISPGKFESAEVDVDLDFFLPRSAEELADLEFTPSDEDLQIPWNDDQAEGDEQDGDELRG